MATKIGASAECRMEVGAQFDRWIYFAISCAFVRQFERTALQQFLRGTHKMRQRLSLLMCVTHFIFLSLPSSPPPLTYRLTRLSFPVAVFLPHLVDLIWVRSTYACNVLVWRTHGFRIHVSNVNEQKVTMSLGDACSRKGSKNTKARWRHSLPAWCAARRSTTMTTTIATVAGLNRLCHKLVRLL